MTAELDRLWDRALALLERDFGPPTIERFIKPLVPVAMADDTVVLAAPNEFTRDYIRPRYRNPICRALSEAAARPLRLEFVVPEADQQAATVTAAPSVSPPRPPAANGDSCRLNPRYTFDTFVVGNCNRFAHAACQAVAQSPGRVYNPLFIYGGVGLGKTHLMHAIAHHILLKNPRTRIAYVSCETFTNELINAIRDGRQLQFRNRYRNVDVLLIDDVQFIAGKETTQQEMFHTFNALHESRRQIVISSDRPPKDIPTLEERLRSRFEWGLLSDIQPPDLETRVAILQKKAQLEGITIPNEVLHYLASRIESNIRELEGALIRLIAYASVHHCPFTVEVAQRALHDFLPRPSPRPLTIAAIQQAVAEYYHIDPRDLKLRKRSRDVVLPRHVAMYLARELTATSFPLIGAEFGGRDHTTVLHAYEKIAAEIGRDPSLAATIAELIASAGKAGHGLSSIFGI